MKPNPIGQVRAGHGRKAHIQGLSGSDNPHPDGARFTAKCVDEIGLIFEFGIGDFYQSNKLVTGLKGPANRKSRIKDGHYELVRNIVSGCKRHR